MSEEVKPVEPAAPAASEAAPRVEVPAAAPAKAEAPAAEVKTEVPTKTPEAPAVPEKYDLKLSEGSLLDANALEEVSKYAKELKLTQEQAQTVLAEREEAVASFVEKQKSVWAEQSKADKEIGGEGLAANVHLSSRVLNRFGSPELKAELDRTGYGNSPEVIRLLTRIGKAMSDDQLVTPGPQTAGKPPIEERFYGSSKEK